MRVALKDGLLGILNSGKIPAAAKVGSLAENYSRNPGKVSTSDLPGSQDQGYSILKIKTKSNTNREQDVDEMGNSQLDRLSKSPRQDNGLMTILDK